MTTDLLKAVLVLVIGYGLRLLLNAIGVVLDEGLFNTIVAAIAVWFLHLFGVGFAAKVAPKWIIAPKQD